MNPFSIILLIVCLILLCVVGWLFLRRNNQSDDASKEEILELKSLVKEKDDAISSLKTEQKNLSEKTESLIAQLKDKSLKELKDSADRISELEEEIAKALEVGTDEIVRKKLAEVDKLTKKIKNLEEELEDAEDETESMKKKSKQLQSENSGLREELENEIRKGKKLLEEINDVKTRLQQVEKDFAIREEAIDFVKEILTAERTSDESVQTLYKNVDGIVEYIRSEVRDTLISIYNIPSENQKAIFDTDLRAWSIAKKKNWIHGKTSIAFVGEFSAGKTSIVNRILSQDDPNVPRLPVSTKATTAIPTYISGGVSTYYQFVTPGNELKGISENTFKRVNKDVLDQVKGVSSLIQYFVMTYKNPNLDQLSILDTPGFNSNDSEDAERTIGVINECDALFWVFDVNAGTVNRSSIKIIKESLTKPLYVVINQIDTKSKSDVDSVENLIRKTLQDEGIKIESVIRFSKKEPLENIMSPILAVKHDNSREQYLEELLAMLSQKVEELANDAKETHKKSNSLANKSSRLVDAFNRAINNLGNDCDTVSKIPQYNNRLFSKDDFRISQEQYSEFITLLNHISGPDLDTLCAKYNEQMETVSQMQSSWDEHSQAISNHKKLEECLEKLRKQANRLSNNYQGSSRKPGNKPSNLKSGQSVRYNYNGESIQSEPNAHHQNNCERNNTSSSPVKDFISYFKWCIIEKKGDNVKIDWDMLLEQMKNVSGKNVSGNTIRKNFSLFGVNNWVSLNELSQVIMTYINK